jgi:nucleoside 2-deoxyribosyltransferase
MSTCFVIQPFDSGKFDKRFCDIYEPAIKASGLDAYRVDLDPTVEVPIESIEQGIRNAAICLADITSDNPNVWYELGYAFAVGRPVVMICSAERENNRYPFDIQHRVVTHYRPDAPSDFANLQNTITERLRAQLNKAQALRQIVEAEQVAPTQGLTQPELMVLAELAGETALPGAVLSLFSLKRASEVAGLTSIGFSLAYRRLFSKGLVESVDARDERGQIYDASRLTEDGWGWIETNESLFVLRKPEPDDDIPF